MQCILFTWSIFIYYSIKNNIGGPQERGSDRGTRSKKSRLRKSLQWCQKDKYIKTIIKVGELMFLSIITNQKYLCWSFYMQTLLGSTSSFCENLFFVLCFSLFVILEKINQSNNSRALFTWLQYSKKYNTNKNTNSVKQFCERVK